MLIIVTNLKDPYNYVKYIKHWDGFLDQIRKEYYIANSLKNEIKQIQRKLRTGSLRLNSNHQLLQPEKDSSSRTDDNDSTAVKNTIVIEPEDLIFTLKTREIEGVVPNLVFEQKDKEGKRVTHYLYLNQSFKPFLKYLCSKFEVIIYSRMKTSLLSQLLSQIKTMVPDLNFSAVLGGSAWLNTKLVNTVPKSPDAEDEIEEEADGSKPQKQADTFDVKIKNVDKIFKKRGKENVLFLDNNLYSYTNWLENYIPVPKFDGKENSSLFFLRFFLEECLANFTPICTDLLSDVMSSE